jgi:hypothetical protein
MKTLEDFSTTVFFIEDFGTWRTYYSVPSFVEAVMNRYGSRSLCVVMQPGKSTLDVSKFAARFEKIATKHDDDAYTKYNYDFTDPAVRKTVSKERKALKAKLVAELEEFLDKH